MQLFKSYTPVGSKQIIVVNQWLKHLQKIFRPVIEFKRWVSLQGRMDMVKTESAPILIPIYLPANRRFGSHDTF
ncbi:hypothetical protein ACFPMF_22930 [Larkinella bovis]|uniref:Uncharacterized protein n=1 Tax=Larkinella bovis TaxID=683041 RepID=A0ABW0IFE4_9BACT